MVTLIMLLTVMVSPVSAVTPQPVPDDAIDKKASRTYIVRLEADPVVAYEGGTNGLAATKPGPGEKINPNSPTVKAYASHLTSTHDSTLAALGPGAHKIHDYVYSFNGFSAVLTGRQAVMLAKSDGVVSVTPDELRQPVTDNSPEFLGLTDPGGLWDQLGGQGSAGEDVIIGVIDTGIWPEHPSFADRDELGKRIYRQVPGWHGKCVPGEEWNGSHCNQKLIGAQYYADGFLAFEPLADGEFNSTRDSDGHGTHTASTAGGNANVEASILGSDLGTVSGIAPRARIAAYKACWNGQIGAGCATSDLVEAIDQAVADGVDVINYSIGSSAQSLTSPDDIAFLFAADAGVFVSASAGNNGPGASTVGSPAGVPWLTSVGASTQDRNFEGSVALGNGASYTGVTITGGTDQLPIVDSEDLTPNGDFTPEQTELCFLGSLVPTEVAGKIVLCQRGVNARVEKSQAVAEADGAGMVLYNAVANQSLNTDNHYVPSIHVDVDTGTAIKAYIDAAGPAATAQIFGGSAVDDPSAPDMASFSSRGPNGAAPDLIKPDVTAPGVNILAGNTPAALLGSPGEFFQAISGTSMSSPHVAGSAALLVQAHPDWTPAMIKSALMTTAHQDVDKEDGTTAADPFDMGAGHIVPTPAADPGLVYDAGFLDYLAFLCGSTDAVGPSTCDFLAANQFSFDASDLNVASIGIADLAGVQTVTRTVTNVGDAGTYTA
ncbi:MAG: S8 family serine peptidase, partial [Chloroflexota bacterium]|nr:S8 family serine peptidase [Chloroflexota bacterium]